MPPLLVIKFCLLSPKVFFVPVSICSSFFPLFSFCSTPHSAMADDGPLWAWFCCIKKACGKACSMWYESSHVTLSAKGISLLLTLPPKKQQQKNNKNKSINEFKWFACSPIQGHLLGQHCTTYKVEAIFRSPCESLLLNTFHFSVRDFIMDLQLAHNTTDISVWVKLTHLSCQGSSLVIRAGSPATTMRPNSRLLYEKSRISGA